MMRKEGAVSGVDQKDNNAGGIIMQQRLNGKTYLWTPLIGFDKNLPEYGAREYLDKLGFIPDAVSLFVFNPDIVTMHEGMQQERMLPLSMSNYYGSVRNEIREIQQWSNYELRGLSDALRKYGVKPLLGMFGTDYGPPPELNLKSFAPHVHFQQDFLRLHPELYVHYAGGGTSNLNVLKRFADGSYFEDFFARRLVETIEDYHMMGVHMADAIMPQAASWHCDFSDDMLEQFVAHSGVGLPAEIAAPVDPHDGEAMTRRRDYLWNRRRLEWLQFKTWRWEIYMKKICDALHAHDMEVTANGFWCTEPFEAYYRYGVDYKALFRAGMDYLLLEDQATAVYVADNMLDAPFNMQKYNLMPVLCKAFAPDGGVLGFNGVKDSTEEWSMISHMPSALEREIYSLPSNFLATKSGLRRAMEGYLVCLADGLNKEEWKWLSERQNLAFEEIPAEVMTTHMVFSDSHIYDFMPEYMRTRRWSHFKQLYEFGARGGQVAGYVRVEDLEAVRGALFVPNIDVLPAEELKRIAAYTRGPIIATTLAALNAGLPGLEPSYVFDDPAAPLAMRVLVYHMECVDTQRIADFLRMPDETPDLAGDPMLAKEPDYFVYDMVYRKVSEGFANACALLIRSAYHAPIDADLEEQVVTFRMKDGRYRLLLSNNLKLNYRRPYLKAKRRIRKIRPFSMFPALPPKLIVEGRRLVVPKDDSAYEENHVTGFMHKIPPHGASFVDVWIDD